MIHQFFNLQKPLGLYDRRKCWIATAVGLAGSVASSIIGGNKARKAAKQAARERQYRANAEKSWYDKAYNTDYLDTKAGQNMLRRAQEIQDEYIRKADGAAAVGGGTAASVAQAKEAANRTMGSTIANIAAQDTARKQQVEDLHLQNVSKLSYEREDAANTKAQNITTATQNASNAIMNAAGFLEGIGKAKQPSVLDDGKPLLSNTSVTSISDGISSGGLISPTKSYLDKAVGVG